jgi:hypothetical protein
VSEGLTDQVMDELEASGVGAGRVRLLFPCGDILDDKDYIAVERKSALALVAEVREVRAQLAEHNRLADETVALLRAAIDLGNKELAEARSKLAELRDTRAKAVVLRMALDGFRALLEEERAGQVDAAEALRRKGADVDAAQHEMAASALFVLATRVRHSLKGTLKLCEQLRGAGPVTGAAARLGITGAAFLAEAKRLGISLSADDLAELEANRG